MTAAELRGHLARLGWSQSYAAKRWQVPLRTLQRWCKDGAPHPIAHLVGLELYLKDKWQ